MDVLSRVQNLISSRSRTDYICDAMKCFNCHVIHVLVLWRGRRADGERSENLPGVSGVEGPDLRDKHISGLDNSIREILRGNTQGWIAHRCGAHKVNVVLT